MMRIRKEFLCHENENTIWLCCITIIENLRKNLIALFRMQHQLFLAVSGLVLWKKVGNDALALCWKPASVDSVK